MKLEEVKFTPDQALQIILKGMETGQIKLPFNDTIKAEQYETEILKAATQHSKTPDFDGIAYTLSRSAWLDSLYLLCLFSSLTHGLTEEEAKKLNTIFSAFTG